MSPTRTFSGSLLIALALTVGTIGAVPDPAQAAEELESEAASDTSDRGCGGAVLLLVLGGGLLLFLSMNRARSGPSGRPSDVSMASSTTPRADSPSKEQLAFVRLRIERHRAECLEYTLWKAGAKAGLSAGELEELLEGTEKRMAMPVLDLLSDDWTWKRGQLEASVQLGLRKMGLDPSGADGAPAHVASEACRRWAETEAEERVAGGTATPS